jgi:hypothetical protein
MADALKGTCLVAATIVFHLMRQCGRMIQRQQHQSIVPLLKSYNASLIFTIISIQAALSFAIPIYTGTNHLLSWTLASCVLVLHLVGAYCFHLSLVYLGLQRPRMIALYALIPFGNIPCVVWLSRAVKMKQAESNTGDKELRFMNAAEIRARIDSFVNRI